MYKLLSLFTNYYHYLKKKNNSTTINEDLLFSCCLVKNTHFLANLYDNIIMSLYYFY